MFRNLAGPATVLAALALVAATGAPDVAAAWPFSAKPAPPPAKPDPNAPTKATPEQRAAAERLSPLVRAAFWQHEVQTDPTDVQAGIGLSSALRALGKFNEAADDIDRVVVLAPKNLDALLEAARVHIAAGQGFYAIQPLKSAMALAPKDWRPVSLMAVALEQDERPDEAITAYNLALKLSPENPAVLSNLALFYATRQDLAQAEALLRRAVNQPQATAQERQNLALLLGLEGKTAEAEHWMRQDLPPEQADANLIYVQGVRAPLASQPQASPPQASPPRAPADQPPKAPSSSTRTWGSVQLSDAKGR